MGLLYEPREKDERVFLGLELVRQGASDAAIAICDAEGNTLRAHAVKFDKDGLRRFLNPEVAKLDCAHDPDGRIALHPDDPAMKRIAELETRVKELDEKHEEALRREKAANDQLHLERCKVNELEAEANEKWIALQERDDKLAATVAPELTNEQCEKLWRVFIDDPSGELDSLRVMFAAYEAMR